jgi:hypothetical protein
MKKLLLLLVAGLGFTVGCGHYQQAGVKTAPPVAGQAGGLSETEVLAIVRQAVATNDTWVDRAEFETPRRQADGSWSVLVWRLPKTPGGHRVIHINDQGQVTNCHRGA